MNKYNKYAREKFGELLEIQKKTQEIEIEETRKLSFQHMETHNSQIDGLINWISRLALAVEKENQETLDMINKPETQRLIDSITKRK